MPDLKQTITDTTCTFPGCKGKPTYRMSGRCGNCQSEPIIGVFTKGHEAKSGWGSPECPVCGVTGHLYWRRD